MSVIKAFYVPTNRLICILTNKLINDVQLTYDDKRSYHIVSAIFTVNTAIQWHHQTQ